MRGVDAGGRYAQRHGSRGAVYALSARCAADTPCAAGALRTGRGARFPATRSFKGGKGIATTFGCLLGLLPFWTPVLVLACIFIFYSTILRITPNLSRTRVTYFTLPLGMLLMEVPLWICFGTLCMTGMVLVRLHISTEEREKPAVHLLWWT